MMSFDNQSILCVVRLATYYHAAVPAFMPTLN